MPPHLITSLDLPALQPYRTLRRPHDHLEQGIFVAEGEKVVGRFLGSTWEVVSLLMTQEWYDAIIPTVPEARLAGVEVFIGPKELLETIVGIALHQGIMAVGKVPKERSLEETDFPSPHFLVGLDGLVHAENVGVIVRNCAAFGVDGVLAGSTTASPYLRRAVRNSMGGVFRVPVVHVADLADSLAWLKEHRGTRILIADAHAEQTLQSQNFAGNICVVFGNEDAGCSAAVEAVATGRVCIPMQKATDSLNVASASAVVLYEARSKRDELLRKKVTAKNA